MSRSILDPRLCFLCEYKDDIANLTRELQLLYFYQDNSVELTDLKTKKIFLRRISCPGLRREQFYLGGSVMVFGRIMTLTRFGDEVTRQLTEESAEFTMLVLRDNLLPKIGSVLAILCEECGFGIKEMRTVSVTPNVSDAVGLPASFTGRPVVVMQAVRRQAVACGVSFVSRVGASSVAVAENSQQAADWTCLLDEPSSAVQGNYNSSVILVKPHALHLGGELVQFIAQEANVTVSAIRSLSQSSHEADYLLQPYKGVLVDYSATVQSISGNVWVVQFVSNAQDQNVLDVVRAVCGPFDPAVAKALAPTTLRARYGLDRVHNAVHCTDVAADAVVYAEALLA
jgi:nucleoside-diphosphate kinase